MPVSPVSVDVRLATPADAAEIASVHVHAWREAYSGILPPALIADLPLTFKSRLNLWTALIASSHSEGVYVAATAEHGVIGFASVGQSRGSFAGQNLGELKALYVLAAYHRRGIASRLLQLGFADLRQRGYSGAYCWVLSDNPARYFFQRAGASIRPEDTRLDRIGGQEFNESLCIWASI